MLPKVSVVVPIYKVEKYLSRCVESIMNQSYSNLQIILVDDGSPDRCGEMAECYAKADPRIQVVHKENGGLSDARNAGIEYVTGEYTLFVDSDDWLEKEMVEEMVNKSIHYKADIVQTAFYYAFDDHLLVDNRHYSSTCNPILLDNKLLMFELVINEKVKNFAWGKLYKTNLVKDIPFKKGVLFEDVYWAHQVMHRVHNYVILHQPMYYYYQRTDSIVATYTPRNLDIIRGAKERHHFIEKYYSELTNESYKTILKMCLIHYSLLLVNRKKDTGGLYRKEICLYVKEINSQLKKAVQTDQHLRRELFLFNLHPYLYVSYLLVKKILRNLKLLPRPIGLKRLNL
ncbi:glycosyltransferase family 2 protein [Paenibacillus sp. 2RAB27]|uniref:glycosyltransferase family 2 protein n=1 Tax=Paenibacillus sp. 2RAB27 TaxID=3232991 RepID=UPI003F96D376